MGKPVVTDLRCEYKINPLGIDVPHPRLSWKLQGERRNVLQAAYQVQVYVEELTADALLWDSGKVNSDQSIHVAYAGSDLRSRYRYVYRVKVWDQLGNESNWSDSACWEMGLLHTSEWSARWITPDEQSIDPRADAVFLLRKAFQVGKKVKQARIYATCHGLYELELNGERVGQDYFAPGWTSYHHRLQVQSYDITSMLQENENVIGLSLANGWFKGDLGWEDQRNIYGEQRAALLQIVISYEDGQEQQVVSDDSWKAAFGPITMSEIYHGETYDARLEKQGWSKPGFDDEAWSGVTVLDYPLDQLVAQENDPVRITEELKAKELIRTPKGEIVIDMGQNMVGWMKFTVQAPAGTRIVLQHAEVLDQQGNFYMDNLRSAKQTVEYICKGGGVESYHPAFSFQGFRYVKVEGYPEPLDVNQFTAQVLHTAMEPLGTFTCSHELINQLQRNIVWGQRGNFLDIPTDCPQRDERMGWTGDAQVFIRTAAFNYQVAPFFTKWLKDLSADQLDNGGVTFVVPQALSESSHSSAAWGDAAVICPWTIYQCYGDKRILEQQYESMKAWVEYIRKQGDNEFLWNTGFHFGDWLGLDAPGVSNVGATPKDLIATAFYAYSTSLLQKAAAVLGKQEDAEIYRELLQQIKWHFNQEFITPNGRIASPTQTAYALALMFKLVEGKTAERLAHMLAEHVKENKYKLSTGFVGTPYLCHVLTEAGYHDIAVKLVQQEEYPSWLYPITKGATTIWEHWDGIKPDGSFWSEMMNSFNHYAYGAIGEWLYQVVAGLNIDENQPGYKRSIIKPRIDSGLEYASVTYQSMYGELKSAWQKEDHGRVIFEVVVPANTTAQVILPASSADQVTESGRPLHEAEGITRVASHPEGIELEIGSGSYSFKIG